MSNMSKLSEIKVIVGPYLAADQMIVSPQIFALMKDAAQSNDTLNMLREITGVPPAAPVTGTATSVVAARKQDDEDLQQEMERDWESRD